MFSHTRRSSATRHQVAFASSRTAGALTRPTGKPTTLAPPAAGSTPKKSTDAAPKPAEGELLAAEETTVPARTGSSSSSSDEERKRKAANKNKSRSVSRGKRSSIFGGLLGKKDKAEEKAEEKKEEKKEEKEEKKDDALVPVEPVAECKFLACHIEMNPNNHSLCRRSCDCPSPHG